MKTVNVCLKEAAFQPPSLLRHTAEFSNFLPTDQDVVLKPILAILEDGGSDHRIEYLKTQNSIIFLFLKHDLDYIVAVQCSPYQSYRNWMERVMSIINLALQSVGLMRQPIVEKYERVMNSINLLADIKEWASKYPGLRETVTDSLFPLFQMFNSLFRRPELKSKVFQTTDSATDNTIHDMFSVIAEMDPTLTESVTKPS